MNRLLPGRKLVLLSLLMGLSKQLTSSDSFITWASHCEMVYSLRVRPCGVPYPPNLSPRGLTVSCFPFQGCTDPLGLQGKCFNCANSLGDVLSPVPNPFPGNLQVPWSPQVSSVGLWKRKRRKSWGANQGRLSAWGWEQKQNLIFCKLMWCPAESSEIQTCHSKF